MRQLICILLILVLSSTSFAFRFYLENDKNFIYAYDLLPSSNLQSVSSALTLAYLVNERSALELEYLSFDSPILAGSSYTVTYRITYGLEKWGVIWPTLMGGWRFIYTPETGFVTPIDFGLDSEIPLSENFSFRIPFMISLFSNDNMLDMSFLLERKDTRWGDFVIGVRNLKPYGGSRFVERMLILLGFMNQI